MGFGEPRQAFRVVGRSSVTCDDVIFLLRGVAVGVSVLFCSVLFVCTFLCGCVRVSPSVEATCCQ